MLHTRTAVEVFKNKTIKLDYQVIFYSCESVLLTASFLTGFQFAIVKIQVIIYFDILGMSYMVVNFEPQRALKFPVFFYYNILKFFRIIFNFIEAKSVNSLAWFFFYLNYYLYGNIWQGWHGHLTLWPAKFRGSASSLKSNRSLMKILMNNRSKINR